MSLIWTGCHATPTSTLWRKRSIFHGKQLVIISTYRDPHPNQSYLLLPTGYPGGRIGRPSRAHSRKLCGHITIDWAAIFFWTGNYRRAQCPCRTSFANIQPIFSADQSAWKKIFLTYMKSSQDITGAGRITGLNSDEWNWVPKHSRRNGNNALFAT